VQRAEHDKRSAASGAGAGYAITFISGDIQGKQHAVIAGIRPLPTHHNPSSRFLLSFAGSRQCQQPARI